MDERLANIDLAFRNGLKDYEVLPPPDVWNSIDSRIKRTSGRAYILRAAAFLAIALTLSVIAYRWAAQSSVLQNNPEFAVNEESSTALPAITRKAPITPIKESGQVIPNVTAPETPEYQENDQVVFTNQDSQSSSIIMPETDIQLPASMSIYNIVHSGSQLNASLKGNVAQSSLPMASPVKQYQDLFVEDNTVQNTPKWSISALASPTYFGSINSGSDELSKQIKSSEKAVVSYSGGVAFAYKLNKRLSIQSGLFYSSMGQEINGVYSFAGFQKYVNTKGGPNFKILTTNGTVYTTNPDVFLTADGGNRVISNYNNDVFDPQKASLNYVNSTMKQTFSYLELPVFLRYKIIDRAVDFNVIGGLSYNLLMDNSVYTTIDGTKYNIGTTGGMNMFSISSSLGMGMEYKFSEKLSLNLEPTFRYYMNPFTTTSGSTFHPYSFGVFSGLSYKF